MFSKILNSVSVLAVSGVLLGSALNLSSWAMDNEETLETGIPISRVIDSQEQLEQVLKLNLAEEQPETDLQIKHPVKFRSSFDFFYLLGLYPKLEVLKMEGLQLEDKEAEGIAVRLSKNPALRELYLANNKIGTCGAGILGLAFVHNNTPVRKLDLGNNQIDSKAVLGISMALMSPESSLEKVNLRNNRIGNSGAEYLSMALAINRSLTFLDIRDNKAIRDVGKEKIRKALEVNKKVKILMDEG